MKPLDRIGYIGVFALQIFMVFNQIERGCEFQEWIKIIKMIENYEHPSIKSS